MLPRYANDLGHLNILQGFSVYLQLFSSFSLLLEVDFNPTITDCVKSKTSSLDSELLKFEYEREEPTIFVELFIDFFVCLFWRGICRMEIASEHVGK